MTTYTIGTLAPPPSMTIERRRIEAVDYADAMRQTIAAWRTHRRPTRLYAESSLTYWWFAVVGDGQTINRNTIGGVEEHGVVGPERSDMDPQETLRLLDEARDDLDAALGRGDRTEAVEAADRVQLHAGNLHHWLNRAGFLPAPTRSPGRGESR